MSDAQKSNRVELSQAFLSVLRTQQGRHWHDIITLIEWWFYLNTDHESIWLPADEKVPEREWHIIQSEKLILTIVWNISGFHLINLFSKGSNSTPTIPFPMQQFHWGNGSKLRSVELIESWSSVPIMHAPILQKWVWTFWSRLGGKVPHSPDLAISSLQWPTESDEYEERTHSDFLEVLDATILSARRRSARFPDVLPRQNFPRVPGLLVHMSRTASGRRRFFWVCWCISMIWLAIGMT
jgi:hypothetical protein